jgi:hypothetical protein
MTTTIGLRELSRGVKAFEGYDYVRIEDKKTKQNKGLIISNKYAKQIETIITNLIQQKEQQEFNELLDIINDVEIKDEFQDMTAQQIKAAKFKKYE